jgi:hypothetical protein
MNNFTKEELESILNWGDVYCEFGASWSYKVHKPLIDKIQSMIDSYCEHECKHESDGYDYFKIKEDEFLMDVLEKRKCQLKCNKCGMLY